MAGYNGKARINPNHPQASAICDCCGFCWRHIDLRYRQEYVGSRVQTTRFLVCPDCWDEPNPSLQVHKLRPDPVPIDDPRPEPYMGYQPDVFATEGGAILVTEDGVQVVKENGA